MRHGDWRGQRANRGTYLREHRSGRIRQTECRLKNVIYLIVDPNFQDDLLEISAKGHVWLASNESPDPRAQAVWNKKIPTSSAGYRMTTFRAGFNPISDVYNLLGTIEDHHPTWDEIFISLQNDHTLDQLAVQSALMRPFTLSMTANGYFITRAVPQTISQ